MCARTVRAKVVSIWIRGPLDMSVRSGFTLLEVLVALALVATAWAGIAAALPRIAGPTPSEHAATQVEDMLRRAREAAAVGRAPVSVELRDGRVLRALGLVQRVDLPYDVVARMEGVGGWDRHGASGAFGETVEAAIVFLPDGSSSGGRVTLSERVEVSPASAAGTDKVPSTRSISVNVSWLTGRIERRP